MKINSIIRNRYNSQFFREEFGKLLSYPIRKSKNELSITNINKKNNDKNYIPLIHVKNFQITNYQFQRYLNIYNSSKEKYNNIEKVKKKAFSFKKSFSLKNITNITLKKKLNMKKNYSINLDYNLFARDMKEKRMKNDKIMEEILNKSEFDNRIHLKLISFRLNIPFIREIEKKRKDYVKKRSLIKNNGIN